MLSDLIFNIWISLRPGQWLKNLVVFAAIIFSRDLFDPDKFIPVFYTFLILCAASSSVYLINDLVDRYRDQLHFSKRNRPIASGKLLPRDAFLVAALLVLLVFISSYQLSIYLFYLIVTYLVIQVLYSLLLKNIIILDVLSIGFAFMLRIFAGSFVVVTALSSWLILTTMMLALFLAIGKRRSELTLMEVKQAAAHRHTLLSYPTQLLDGLAFMMGTATLITYSLFTFNSPDILQTGVFATILPQTLSSAKFLMATIPIVVYGIFRYLYLIFEKKEGESPERVLLTDKPLFIAVVTWFVLIIFFLYFFPI